MHDILTYLIGGRNEHHIGLLQCKRTLRKCGGDQLLRCVCSDTNQQVSINLLHLLPDRNHTSVVDIRLMAHHKLDQTLPQILDLILRHIV